MHSSEVRHNRSSTWSKPLQVNIEPIWRLAPGRGDGGNLNQLQGCPDELLGQAIVQRDTFITLVGVPVVSKLHDPHQAPVTLHGFFFEALHHGYVALVLVAMTLILEHHGWLNWLDSLSLRVASNVTIGVTDRARGVSNSIADRPLTVLISDEMFERDFGQASPLERGLLAEIVGSVLATNPLTLAIDLDLSPGPGLVNEARQRRLDETLIQGARSGVKVVVTAPFPVSSDAVIAEKYAWMRRLCDSGVDFAFPYLLEMHGVVLRYPGESETLGRVASRAHSQLQNTDSLCNQSKQGVEHAAFLSKDFPVDLSAQFDNLATQRPLNPAFFDDVQTVLVSNISDFVSLNLSNRIVVLGAGFNPNDQFNTAFGLQKGPTLHAATIFSELHPTHVSHTFSILLDLLLGVVAGFIFHAVWQRFHVSQQRSREVGNWPPNHYFAARGWLLASCVIFAASVVVVTISSAWLFRHNLWNNPGPMIGGFFVKTLIASRPHQKHDDATHKPILVVHKLMLHIDQLWFLPIVIWGGLLLFH